MNSIQVLRNNERGSAGLKLLGVLVVLGLVINAGINYIPVAYNGKAMVSDMETAVLQGLASPGKIDPVANVKDRVMKAMVANNIPNTAIVDVKSTGQGIVNARVAYEQKVSILPFGIYTYTYKFDNTATPSGMLLKDIQSR